MIVASIGHVFLARHVAVTARRGFVLRPRRASHSCPVAPISPDARSQVINEVGLHASIIASEKPSCPTTGSSRATTRQATNQ